MLQVERIPGNTIAQGKKFKYFERRNRHLSDSIIKSQYEIALKKVKLIKHLELGGILVDTLKYAGNEAADKILNLSVLFTKEG